MDEQGLLQRWRDAAARPHEGWDFSGFAGRITEEPIPWDFTTLARDALGTATALLDMGTGGGEHLLSLAPGLPDDTTATEGWAPNIPVARRNLGPAGIDVAEYDADADPRMPFADQRFDLVYNRHEAFDAGEVHRVLRPGGVFLTQQVCGDEFGELYEMFGTPNDDGGIVLSKVRAQVEAAGLEVEDSAEWYGVSTYADVETLVEFLSLTPWYVPEDFTVDRYADTLLALHDRTQRGQPLTFTTGRFWLRAVRP